MVRAGAVAAGVAGLGFFLGYLVTTQLVFPRESQGAGELVKVPALFHQRLPSVERTLADVGLARGRVDTLEHPTVVEGAVLAQAPLPGQLQRPGDSVRVTVSGGPERRAVPDVRRLRAGDAATILESSGFRVVRDSVFAEEAPGRVVRLSPPAGEAVALPHEVRLVVSRGPRTVSVPLLLTLEYREARARIETLGLVVSAVERVEVSGLDPGTIIGQRPAAGTEVERGSAVRLTVVDGPDLELSRDSVPDPAEGEETPPPDSIAAAPRDPGESPAWRGTFAVAGRSSVRASDPPVTGAETLLEPDASP